MPNLENVLANALDADLEINISNEKLELGVSWNFYPEQDPVDLDCSAICFDDCGLIQDAVFFNNRRAASGALLHSGDSLKGDENTYAETIIIDIEALPAYTELIVFTVNAFSGGSFSCVESACADLNKISANGPRCTLSSVSIGCGTNSAGCIFSLLYRNKSRGSWMLRRVGHFCDGRNFLESLPAIRTHVDTLTDPALRNERQLSHDKTFNMNKGGAVEIPSSLLQGSYDIRIGMGWSSTYLNLDASVILSDGKGACLGIVNATNQRYFKVIQHCGDKVKGKGKGDDEKIDINLHKMPSEVLELYCVVTVNTKYCNFSEVKDAYIRLIARNGNKELCRYQIGDMMNNGSNEANALVLAKLYRAADTNTWLLRALGTACNGRETSSSSATSTSILAACGIDPAAPIPDPATYQGKSKSKQHKQQSQEDGEDDCFGDFDDNGNDEGESSCCVIA